MGGFAPEFRGFWVEQGCGAAIQCTADMGERSGRKNFLQKGRKTEKLGCERCRKVVRGHLIEVRFVQAPQLQAPTTQF